MADLNEMTWRWALGLAEIGEPAELARLIVTDTPPGHLRDAIQGVIGDPPPKAHRHGPRRRFTAIQADQIRTMYAAFTSTPHPNDREDGRAPAGHPAYPWAPAYARSVIAAALHSTEEAIRDVIERKKAYAQTVSPHAAANIRAVYADMTAGQPARGAEAVQALATHLKLPVAAIRDAIAGSESD